MLLQSAGRRVKELVDNLERFTATERIENAQMAKNGKWSRLQSRSFRYLAFISEIRPGILNVDEQRTTTGSSNATSGRIESSGLAAFALIFHPYYADDFQMACEGLGDWNGQPAWQVHFAQRPDVTPRFHSFVAGQRRYNLKIRGRAWITADNFQVARLEVDLGEPVPQVRLLTEHMSIDYQPIHFAKRNLDLWLPQSVELYLDYRGKRYRHFHHLSNFLLFSVDTDQQIKEPDQPE